MTEPITNVQTRIMVALALEAKGDRLEAARILEGVASDIRIEERGRSMDGTAARYQDDGVQRFCGNCGRGVVIVGPTTDGHRARSFRIDRRYCSAACRQAAYRKRQPAKPPKAPKVIYL